MKKLLYFIKRFGYNALPSGYFKRNYQWLHELEKKYDAQLIADRLSYYCKVQDPFLLPNEAVQVGQFSRQGRTEYYLDLKEFLHYFHSDTAFTYRFGDSTDALPYPALTKARAIDKDNNAILFKLNKNRHFQWVNDKRSFVEKKSMAVWRGGAYLEPRIDFVQKLWQHPQCDIGQTNKPKENVPWQKDFLSRESQLENRYIFCIEGNDVATNLKWVLSSNSLCLMPRPKKETWFMEGRLESGVHYVELSDDYSNLDEIIKHYDTHPEEAVEIISNAHKFVNQFRDNDLEDLLCLKVLEKYTQLSGQSNALKF